MRNVLLPRRLLAPGMAAATLLAAAGAHGDGMQIRPGRWEVKATVQQPDGERTDTTTQCLEVAELTPATLAANATQCKFEGVETTTTSLSWRMSCDLGGDITTTGSGRYTGGGEAVSGTVTAQTKIGDRTTQYDSRFEARRIGDC